MQNYWTPCKICLHLWNTWHRSRNSIPYFNKQCYKVLDSDHPSKGRVTTSIIKVEIPRLKTDVVPPNLNYVSLFHHGQTDRQTHSRIFFCQASPRRLIHNKTLVHWYSGINFRQTESTASYDMTIWKQPCVIHKTTSHPTNDNLIGKLCMCRHKTTCKVNLGQKLLDSWINIMTKVIWQHLYLKLTPGKCRFTERGKLII